MNSEIKGILQFEGCELDLRNKELRRQGVRIPIQMQPFNLLIYLALHSREIVSRKTLRRRLWDQQTFVDFDAGLNFCIRQIRKALGEDGRKPRIIETLRGLGYRFLPRVELSRSTPMQVNAVEKIRVTFHPQSPPSESGREMQRLAEEITRLVVASCRNSEASTLFASLHGNAIGRAATHETTWNTEVRAIPGKGLQVRIHRGQGSEPRLVVLRAG
jgi:DNA-binding winged helix-turn-helix (wHTH) protein